PDARSCCRQAAAFLEEQTNPLVDLARRVAVFTPAAPSSASRSTSATLSIRSIVLVMFPDDGRVLSVGLAKAKRRTACSAAPQPKFSALNLGRYCAPPHRPRLRLS